MIRLLTKPQRVYPQRPTTIQSRCSSVRGTVQKDAKPLDLSNVVGASIMIRRYVLYYYERGRDWRYVALRLCSRVTLSSESSLLLLLDRNARLPRLKFLVRVFVERRLRLLTKTGLTTFSTLFLDVPIDSRCAFLFNLYILLDLNSSCSGISSRISLLVGHRNWVC